jgi:16S rRNA (guanine527-N7)-methyltransferase
MSLHRVACPTAQGSRAAARWFRRSSDAVGSGLGQSRSASHPRGAPGPETRTFGGGGFARRTRRGLGTVAPSATAEVDTDALIASYLDEKQLKQVRTFAATLLERNKHMNLTGALTVDEVLTRHVADSLALIPAIESALGLESGSDVGRKITLLDVGSGAGFPGMALAIARPRWEITLLDTLQKRTTFLAQAANECGVSNVKTLWSRAEDAGSVGSEHREAYDLVTARAVAELRVLSELCVPMVKVGGAFLAAKNSIVSTREELDAAASAVNVLGGEPFRAEEVCSVGPDGNLRTAVISRKATPTPEKYPRRAGMPNKRPL